MQLRLFTSGLLIALSLFCSQVMADQIMIKVVPSSLQANTSQSRGTAGLSSYGAQRLSQAGEPDLPHQVVGILLPMDADLSSVSVSVQGKQLDLLEGVYDLQPRPPAATWDGSKVIEVWPEGEPIQNGRNTNIYGKDDLFPQNLVKNITSGQLRQWRLLEVPVALYEYNPVQKLLYRLTEAELSVEFSTQSVRASSSMNFSDRIGESDVRRLAVNFDSVSASYRTGGPLEAETAQNGRYVIITTTNIVNHSSQLANFISSKEDQGFGVLVVTEGTWGGGIGDTAADNIRGWLVANAASLNIEYVLLMGNPNPTSGDVPMKMLWPRRGASFYAEYQESPSDYYYSDLTGNWDLDGDGYFGEWSDDFGPGGVDRNWDVLVGRIPFYGNFDDLDNILAKLIAYREESSETGSWRNNVLLPMKSSDASTPGYQLGEAIKDNILSPKSGWDYHRVYDQEYGLTPLPETVPCTIANVTDEWKSSLFGAVFWWTHGSSSLAVDVMDPTHAAALNDAFPAFTFQCSCSNSWPEYATNLSYSLLRNGAVGTVGATRVSWYWFGETDFAGSDSNAGMTYEYARRFIEAEMTSAQSLLSLKQAIAPGCSEMWMNWTGFNLYGDPSLGLFSFSYAPSVSSFGINQGASSTAVRTVTLNNTCAANPTQFMAGESASFAGATWQTYSTAPSFTLSSGNGLKTVYFRVRNGLGQSSAVTDTITLAEVALPVVTVTSLDAYASEPGTNMGKFRFTRTGSTAAALAVRYSIHGTAANGTDYKTLSGSLVIAAGSPYRDVVVTPIDDALTEGNETVMVTLLPSTAYQTGTPGSAAVIIADNEPALPVVTVSAPDENAAELGNNTGKFRFTRTGSTTAGLTVKTCISGTAVNGTDYKSLPTTVVIPAGSLTKDVVVTPLDDTVVEGNETVVLTLGSSAAYRIGPAGKATVTIVSNE
jgi:hypothetical protein